MTALSLPGLAEAVIGSIAAVGAMCAGICRFVPLDEPEQPSGETRLFIDTSLLPDSSLLRVAPVVLAAEAWHRASGPIPAALGGDEPCNYWPDWVPYPARHRLTSKEDSYR